MVFCAKAASWSDSTPNQSFLIILPFSLFYTLLWIFPSHTSATMFPGACLFVLRLYFMVLVSAFSSLYSIFTHRSSINFIFLLPSFISSFIYLWRRKEDILCAKWVRSSCLHSLWSCSIELFLCLTLFSTSPFGTSSVDFSFSILLQHHLAKDLAASHRVHVSDQVGSRFIYN